MVSTRHHPRDFPSPEDAVEQWKQSSPGASTSARSRTSRSTTAPRTRIVSAGGTSSDPTTPSPAERDNTTGTTTVPVWTHTPSALTLFWLYLSLPLVIWDTGYVLGRPHTMPGGSWSYPLYAPYALYGQVDRVYGLQYWDAKIGFTGAQSAMNIFETIGYLIYLYILFRWGTVGTGSVRSTAAGKALGARTLHGSWAGRACLVGFAMPCLTLAKTMLYAFNEHYSAYAGIGHNESFWTLLFIYIIPDGAWIVFPLFLVLEFGQDILRGLSMASQEREQSGLTKKLITSASHSAKVLQNSVKDVFA